LSKNLSERGKTGGKGKGGVRGGGKFGDVLSLQLFRRTGPVRRAAKKNKEGESN